MAAHAIDAQDSGSLHKLEMMEDGTSGESQAVGQAANGDSRLSLQQTQDAQTSSVADAAADERDEGVVHADCYRQLAHKEITAARRRRARRHPEAELILLIGRHDVRADAG